MGIDELLDTIRGVTGDTLGDLPGYCDDVARFVSGQNATLEEVNSALAEKDAEIQRLQAENYKLMTAAAAPAYADTTPDPSEDESGDFSITDYIKED